MTIMSDFVSKTVERFGKLDVIFANAGTVAFYAPREYFCRNFREHYEVNLTATFFFVASLFAAPE